MDDSLHFLQSMYCCSHLPLNFFLQVKNLSIVSVAKIFVPSFDLDITNKDWSQPLPTISININIEQNCQQSRICCQPCFQFWTCEYLKSLMLIAVYSCNPFEDYHRITIHYNISHKMFLERERARASVLYVDQGEMSSVTILPPLNPLKCFITSKTN